MFNKWKSLRERKTEEVIFSPLSGKVLRMEDVPDPAFAKRMAGWGIAIDPSEGQVMSPVDGEIIHIFRTKHAVWIRSGSGVDILIHIGLDTVNMDGEGFHASVKIGDQVRLGQPIIRLSSR
jgi:PTS system glucose-specific IIA component